MFSYYCICGKANLNNSLLVAINMQLDNWSLIQEVGYDQFHSTTNYGVNMGNFLRLAWILRNKKNQYNMENNGKNQNEEQGQLIKMQLEKVKK